nr:hypothetical protein CFP56_50593 [Quercus suber]
MRVERMVSVAKMMALSLLARRQMTGSPHILGSDAVKRSIVELKSAAEEEVLRFRDGEGELGELENWWWCR